MSSLVVGEKFFGTVDLVPYDVIIQKYNAHNALLNRHDAFQIANRNEERLRILCAGHNARGEKCASQVNARHKFTDDGVKFAVLTKVNLTHTCTAESGRKRKLKGAVVQGMAGEVLSSYIPGGVARGGDPKQLQQIVEKKTGYRMGYQSAQRSVKAAKGDTTAEALAQFRILEPYFGCLQRADPGGRYEVVAGDNETGSRDFRYLYVAPSVCRNFWKHSRRCVSVDGTHVTTILGGVLLLLCVLDANNQNLILAFAYVPIEDSQSYRFFFRRVARDFPGRVVVITDGDKGCASEMLSMWPSATLSRCFRHKIQNYHKNNAGDRIMRENVHALIYGMARATSEDLWNYLRQKLSNVDEDGRGERIATWMDSIKEEVSAKYFNDKGLMRFGALLNNPCEQSNGEIVPLRGLPVVRMVRGILQESINRKVFQRNAQSLIYLQQNEVFTDYAKIKIQAVMEKGRNWSVSVLELTDTKIRADVVSMSDTLVTFNCTLGQEGETSMYICTCRKMWDTGCPCQHISSVFSKVKSMAGGNHWDQLDLKWYLEKATCLTSAYAEQYSASIPSTTFEVALDPTDLEAWEIPRKAGRPKKRRMFSGDGGKRECQACGQTGHYSNTCDKAEKSKLLQHEKHQRKPLLLGTTSTLDLTMDD